MLVAGSVSGVDVIRIGGSVAVGGGKVCVGTAVGSFVAGAEVAAGALKSPGVLVAGTVTGVVVGSAKVTSEAA